MASLEGLLCNLCSRLPNEEPFDLEAVEVRMVLPLEPVSWQDTAKVACGKEKVHEVGTPWYYELG